MARVPARRLRAATGAPTIPWVLQVLALVVPFGLAGAVSPVMLTEQTVVLSGPGGRRAAIRYAAGAMLALLAYVAVLLLFGRSIDLPKDPHLDATLDVVVGAGLLVVALVLGLRHPRARKPADAPRRELTAREAFGFGVVSMATNVTTLALVVPAAKAIAASHVGTLGRAVAAVVLVVLASIPAWLPIALTTVAPGPADRGLRALGDLLKRRGHTIMVVVVAALGAFLVVRGVIRL